MDIAIRPERDTDRLAIWETTKSAFEGRPYADGDEQDLIDRLRELGALSVSLVAIEENRLIGQITISPATITSGIGNWHALGPISVLPERQGQGIGSALISAGMRELECMDSSGCILTGDPQYYSRHGFAMAPEHCPKAEPSEYFMLRLLGDQPPQGQFEFHEAFYVGT